MATRRIDFRAANFGALAQLWNDFYPAEYAISAELLKQNTVGSPLFDWGASSILIENEQAIAFMALKKSAARLYKGPDEAEAHITALAFKQSVDAIDLMANVRLLLRNRGISKIAYGRDSRHFFPGCPVEASALAGFLKVEGFEPGAEVVDLTRDMRDYKNPARPVSGAEFRNLSHEDRPSLNRFFAQNFSGRWAYDVLEKASIDGIENTIFGLLIDGEVHGFALLQDWRHTLCIGGGVWKESLGANWGSLGPIGVSEGVRGKGFGNALLGAALEELKSRAVHNAIIDWTGLIDFYAKHGFAVSHRYTYQTLTLED